MLFKSAWYCAASLPGLKATTYGVGRRVVVQGVSVTAVTTQTVTLSALDWHLCSPDVWGCVSYATDVSMVVAWTGTTRPARGTVVNVFGTTATGSIVPAGYTASSACYIDYC